MAEMRRDKPRGARLLEERCLRITVLEILFVKHSLRKRLYLSTRGHYHADRFGRNPSPAGGSCPLRLSYVSSPRGIDQPWRNHEHTHEVSLALAAARSRRARPSIHAVRRDARRRG